MISLLSTYSITEIIMFLVIAALAIKGVIDFFDWVKNKNRGAYIKEKTNEDEKRTTKERITKLEESVEKVTDSVNKIGDKVDLLVASDKDAIKAFITREHHYFCYQKGWIDDYSLDCLEKRYTHYVEENGNSFIGELMAEVRKLPRRSPESDK